MERAARKVWAQDAGLTAAALARIINQFWRARDIDALASAAEDLARLDPDNSEPYAVLGEMYWNSGQPEPARAAYAAAAKRETRTTMQALYEGYESVIGGNNERAVEWFERAIAADGSNWRAMVALANARLNEGQPAAAKEWLTRAHRVAPQNSDITRALQQIQGQ